MQHFILISFAVLLTTVAIAPTGQAIARVDTDFNIQTLRLSEVDARSESETSGQPDHYLETPVQRSTQPIPAGEANTQAAESTLWGSHET